MNWFLNPFSRRRIYTDLSAEIRQHLEERTEQLMREENMSGSEARQAAKKAFGNATLLEERGREVWEWPTLESIWADIRYACRQMRRSPGFAATVILLLGLGTGAATAVFSLVDAILLRPLPYPDSDAIVIPWNMPPTGNKPPGWDKAPWDPIQFRAIEKETTTFKNLGAFKGSNFNLTGSGDPAMLEGALVTWGFFPALGVSPAVGRVFTPEEDTPGHEHEVLLSDALWRTRFNSDRSIVNRTIQLNGVVYNIIGVMPRGFGFPRANEMPDNLTFPGETQLWVPMALPETTPPFYPSDLAIIGRLPAGVSVGQAQAAMDLFATHMDREHPNAKGFSNSLVISLQHQVTGDTRKPLLLILASVGVILLVVCFNVAGLLLARAISRQREFTLRAALGAGRSRVLRQLLTESLILAIAGGSLGVLVAAVSVLLVKAFGPESLPRLQEVAIDLRMFAFTSGISVLSAAVFGLAPAIGATRIDLTESLKAAGARTGSGTNQLRLRSALVVSQTAMAFMLIIAAGLLVRTFYELLTSDPGFRPEHVLTFEVSLPDSRYPDREHIARFYQQVLPRLDGIAGVESAGITESIPMSGATDATAIRIVGRTLAKGQRNPVVNYTVVSPGLFQALGTPLLRGRDLLDRDQIDAPPVTIINRAMASAYWPNEDAIGKQLIVPFQRVPATVVGIVADIKHSSLREAPGPEMFEPYTQNVWPSMALMQVAIRTNAEPATVIGAAREAIRGIDPGVPLSKISTLSTLTDKSVAPERFSMLLVGSFGMLALLLSAIGIYGVISYSVGQRTREIGVRIALGARREHVFGMILRHGLKLTALGIAAGIVAAFAMSHAISSVLYGVRTIDPLTFAVVAVLLSAVATAACLLPARHAAKIDPMRALRSD